MAGLHLHSLERRACARASFDLARRGRWWASWRRRSLVVPRGQARLRFRARLVSRAVGPHQPRRSRLLVRRRGARLGGARRAVRARARARRLAVAGHSSTAWSRSRCSRRCARCRGSSPRWSVPRSGCGAVRWCSPAAPSCSSSSCAGCRGGRSRSIGSSAWWSTGRRSKARAFAGCACSAGGELERLLARGAGRRGDPGAAGLGAVHRRARAAVRRGAGACRSAASLLALAELEHVRRPALDRARRASSIARCAARRSPAGAVLVTGAGGSIGSRAGAPDRALAPERARARRSRRERALPHRARAAAARSRLPRSMPVIVDVRDAPRGAAAVRARTGPTWCSTPPRTSTCR